MKRVRPLPARARRAAVNEAIATSVSEQRSFAPDELSARVDRSRVFRGHSIEEWERLERLVEQRRCLDHLRTCRKRGCPVCENYAPRKVHALFFDTTYDPLAA